MTDKTEREQRAVVSGILEEFASKLQALPPSAAKGRALNKVLDLAADLNNARHMLGDFKPGQS